MFSVKKKTIVILVLFLLLSNILTFSVTKGIYNRGISTVPDYNDIDSGEREELAAFLEVLDTLSKRYIEEVSVDELIEEAIKGMVNSLDDEQTSYMDSDYWQKMIDSMKGSFSGIGVEIASVEGIITIINPIRGTPGEQAGLMTEDRIVEVDGQDIKGITAMDAVSLIRGPEGTTVTLKVERDSEPDLLIFKIVRSNIMLPSVSSQMLQNNIGYIEIVTFDDHTGEDFSVALMELENKKISGLILDLRNNPGGLLSEAVKVAQELLPAGPITYMVDRDGNKIDTYYSYGIAKPYRIVALVNAYSASAAEIIAGALQDSNAGVLVGTKTFGKATVQHLQDLPGNTGLRYTVAKYRTPNDRDIHGVGLEPDFFVELPNIAYHHPITLDLKKNDENSNVAHLQRILLTIGYNVQESGVFDGSTEKAVRSFQSKHGLTVTGEVKHDTRKKLLEELDNTLEKLDTQKLKAIGILSKQ